MERNGTKSQYFDTMDTMEKQDAQPALAEMSGSTNDINNIASLAPTTDTPSPDQANPVAGNNAATPVKDLDPAAERLARDLTPLTAEDFYGLMGVRSPETSLDALEKLAEPLGLYSRMYKEMQYNNRKFKAFDITAYALLLLQVLLSGIFIILGSLRNVDTHLTIAILGAVAAVVSGALALMKGQGLPNRLRQTRDSLRDVMFEAEELFWDFRSGRPVLYKDVVKVRANYLRAIEQSRQNHPDVWVGSDELAELSNRRAAPKGWR